MRKAYRTLVERIDARALRERCIGFVLVLAGLYLAWDAVLFQPVEARRNALDSRVGELREGIQALNAQVGQLALARTVDPDRDDRRRVASLREALAGVDAELLRVTHHLVPPKEMARLLEAVLTHETDLELVKLEGLGAEPLVAVALADSAELDPLPADGPSTAPALFRHGLQIDFEGGYLETLRYLLALEGLDWRFLWDTVSYRVADYPNARVSITVFSLSLDGAWIGV